MVTLFRSNPPRQQKSLLFLNLAVSSLTDGLGRTVQTSLDSDPEGVDYTDTNYDVFGRVSVSNPYRSTSDQTYGITTNLSDALGRVYQTTKQDGSISSVGLQRSYNDLCEHRLHHYNRRSGQLAGRLLFNTFDSLVEVDEPDQCAAATNATGCSNHKRQ